ncbi:MAG: rRNA pseudouridine synthase [Treponema sp.]|nr:rRNA pseudouridine synthase [Treponema sp.]
MAKCGAASRRASEGLILAGRVKLNGQTITQLGTKVESGDTVTLDGKELRLETQFHYLLLHKPPMYICSNSDPQGRSLAIDLLPKTSERLYNVGRLDYRSSGLIIFTNDGNFAEKIGHPRAEIEKEYLVISSVTIHDNVIDAFKNGVEVEGIMYKAKNIERLTGDKTIKVTLIEGKNREIRRVFSHFHLHPETLQRIRIGHVEIGDLEEGETRKLTSEEIQAFYS